MLLLIGLMMAMMGSKAAAGEDENEDYESDSMTNYEDSQGDGSETQEDNSDLSEQEQEHADDASETGTTRTTQTTSTTIPICNTNEEGDPVNLGCVNN